MPDPFYPTIDIAFIEAQIVASGKTIEGSRLKIGSTLTFVMTGTQAMYKRTLIIRELQAGQISFENATAIALKFNFMGTLLKWLEDNRHWKDGAYIVAQ